MTQFTTGRPVEGSTTDQAEIDIQSTGQTSPESKNREMYPTFKDALDSLSILAAQCGSHRIRTVNSDNIFAYMSFHAIQNHIEKGSKHQYMFEGMSAEEIRDWNRSFKRLCDKRDGCNTEKVS